MALYALDKGGSLFAADAIPGKAYHCLECLGPVKIRRGKDRFPHFYHLHRSPQCHLYSKCNDHLILQLQLQRLFSKETVYIERSFPSIHRIADLVWEKEKIAFEIQCSLLDVAEARQRIVDYGTLGYRVVWLLDDRLFNQKVVRDLEKLLRPGVCYFFSFQKRGISQFYDQMEIVIHRKRIKKGRPLKVDLTQPYSKPFLDMYYHLTRQIQERIRCAELYFQGDLVHQMLQSTPHFLTYLAKWREYEIAFSKSNRLPNVWIQFFQKYLVRSYHQLFDWLFDRLDF